MGDNSSVPRLGTGDTKARPKATREVELPDCGASLLLAKPRIGAVLDFDVSPDATNREGFEATVGMLMTMCVEPTIGQSESDDLTEAAFRQEMADLSPEDWVALSEVVVELSGAKQELTDAAKDRFREARDEAIPVPAGPRPASDRGATPVGDGG